jgi:DNA invertase Pin-like site-specific DNA recombinase
MLKRVIAYYRPFPWSRIGADRTGRTGVEKSVRNYCRERGLRMTAFLVETDERIRRPFEYRTVGSAVMTRLRSGEADGILVGRLEHVFSSVEDAVASLERWMDDAIEFHCIHHSEESTLSLVPSESMDMGLVIRGLSELQRRIDVERSHQRVLNRQGTGAWRGRVPFGFVSVNGVLVEEPDRIDRIAHMKRAHQRGMSYRQIARMQGISVATAHRLVKTDLRKLRKIGTHTDAPPSC